MTSAEKAVVLSTCNRTEVYLANREPKAATARAHAGLANLARLRRPRSLRHCLPLATMPRLYSCSGSLRASTRSFRASRRS
jgi:glutamyl-tRNA reductase